MDEQIQALQAMIDNPDDLSSLPQVIEQLKEHKQQWDTQSASDLDRITNLQESNRKLLSQIPIASDEPKDDPADDGPTFDQAKEQLFNAMQNIGGQ